MPSQFDITSASAGDMFMGAFLPGLVLVGLYMAYILISSFLRPDTAPPVRSEGAFDRRFALRVLLSLAPPLALIFAVLGSIVLGVATVNQAGAIGAIGAMVMAGYRLRAGERGAYHPAIVTAVWLGVMSGLNIQTSFLTPPFGFALFYLRGVAPPSVRTLQIYRGAVAFIVLQLAGLAIAGYFPALVNYLPNRIYLTSDTAPRR